MQTAESVGVTGETLLLRLSRFGPLGPEEREVLRQCFGAVRHEPPHSELLVAGRPSAGPTVILSGIACRFTLLRNGKRQITSYLLPGDICEFRFLTNSIIEQGVRSLSAATCVTIPQVRLTDACERYPNLVKALLQAAAAQEAVTREWLISLGQRSAVERMAHLLCELYCRLKIVGLVNGMSFHLPLTQSELGESMGLSTVHVNRTLQELRRNGLIETRDKTVHIIDFAALSGRAMFDPAYLGTHAVQ